MSRHHEPFRLSVLLVTYNHERYVRQALLSIFRQQTTGPIELVVADDNSTDRTLEIVREAAAADDRFQLKILPTDARMGVTANYERGFAACTGEYVAILEGDDYWTHPRKIHRQLDFLESHWECDLCAVNYFMFNEDSGSFQAIAPAGEGHRYLDARQMLFDNAVGNFSACLYRRSALSELPRGLFQIESYDWIVNVCIARTSLIGFLNEPMSIYRCHDGGVWTQKTDVEKLTRQLELIPSYDEVTAGQFHREFDELSERLRRSIDWQHKLENRTLAGSTLGRIMEACPRARRLPDFTPPLVMAAGRLLVPPAFKRRFAMLLNEARSE